MAVHCCVLVYTCLLLHTQLYTDYLNTLCELESFIESNPCDGVCIACDFNVDFGRGGSHVNSLGDFV